MRAADTTSNIEKVIHSGLNLLTEVFTELLKEPSRVLVRNGPHTIHLRVVGAAGFEPATSCSQSTPMECKVRAPHAHSARDPLGETSENLVCAPNPVRILLTISLTLAQDMRQILSPMLSPCLAGTARSARPRPITVWMARGKNPVHVKEAVSRAYLRSHDGAHAPRSRTPRGWWTNRAARRRQTARSQ